MCCKSRNITGGSRLPLPKVELAGGGGAGELCQCEFMLLLARIVQKLASCSSG